MFKHRLRRFRFYFVTLWDCDFPKLEDPWPELLKAYPYECARVLAESPRRAAATLVKREMAACYLRRLKGISPPVGVMRYWNARLEEWSERLLQHLDYPDLYSLEDPCFTGTIYIRVQEGRFATKGRLHRLAALDRYINRFAYSLN